MLGVLVPEMKGSVAPSRAKCAVLRVKGDGVDGEDVGIVDTRGGLRSVAFETEIGAAIFFLDVLYGAAAFDATDGKTAPIAEAGDDSCLPF